MEFVIEKAALPTAIGSDAEYNALSHELNTMHNAFAAGDMSGYDDERFRAIVKLLHAYYPPDKLHSLPPSFIIQDEAEFDQLMAEFQALAGTLGVPDLGTPEQARYEILLPAIKEYESRVRADLLDDSDLDAVDMILGHMDRLGLHQKDLAPLLGGQNRVSEVLNRKRPLTVKMMRALHERLGISYDDLFRQAKNYHLSRKL